MNKILTQEKSTLLLAAHAASNDKVICDRLKAVLWYDDGWTHEQIAEALFINVNTSVRHVHDYLKRNKLDKKSGGKESKLSLDQSKKLMACLTDKIYTKVDDIITLCRVLFQITYSRTGMTDWLNRNNFTYKKPEKTLPYVFDTVQRKYVEQYQELKQKVEFSQGKERNAIYGTLGY